MGGLREERFGCSGVMENERWEKWRTRDGACGE